MKELIKYLTAILNIKTDSDLVILDMTSEIQGVADIADYREFIRKNLNYLGMEYLTGFQKFVKLTEMYKRQYAEATNAGRIADSERVAIEIADKVKKIAPLLDDKDLSFSSFKEGKPFTKFEVSQLMKIGSLRSCVRLQRSVSGGDALLDKLKEVNKAIVINKALGHKQADKTHKGVSNLIGNAVKNTQIA